MNTVTTKATVTELTRSFNIGDVAMLGQLPRPKGRGLQKPYLFRVSPNQLKRLAWITSNGE